MNFKHLLFAFFVFAKPSIALSQNSPITLAWKIAKGDTLKYQTTMSSEALKSSDTSQMDTSDATFGKVFANLYKSVQRANSNIKYQSNLFINSKNDKLIDIETKMLNANMGSLYKNLASATAESMKNEGKNKEKKHKKEEKEELDSLDFTDTFGGLGGLNSTIVLRGRMTKSGQIVSDYYKNTQNNLVTILFSLPDKPIKIGERWALDVKMIEMDQNFYADSTSKLNEAYIEKVIEKDGDQIAVINYVIKAYISGDLNNPFISLAEKSTDKKTVMKCTHTATGYFSISKGKWLSYDGVMQVENNFIPFGSSKTVYKLIE